MDTQYHEHIHGIDELERKADELISLMLSLCEERIRGLPAMPDARATSLIHTAMSARYAVRAFLALARIN
ncbi:MAG: hypothetical protein LBU06_10015 [Desulfovibrio sp.]|jgi:hypothetical protein|nr:hypothetical protein [Desulfovibrio sp.]